MNHAPLLDWILAESGASASARREFREPLALALAGMVADPEFAAARDRVIAGIELGHRRAAGAPRKWTPESVEGLRRMRASGMTWKQISAVLTVSATAAALAGMRWGVP